MQKKIISDTSKGKYKQSHTRTYIQINKLTNIQAQIH